MFKYDTVHGIYDGTVENDDSNLIVDGKKIKVGGLRPRRKRLVDVSHGFARLQLLQMGAIAVLLSCRHEKGSTRKKNPVNFRDVSFPDCCLLSRREGSDQKRKFQEMSVGLSPRGTAIG